MAHWWSALSSSSASPIANPQATQFQDQKHQQQPHQHQVRGQDHLHQHQHQHQHQHHPGGSTTSSSSSSSTSTSTSKNPKQHHDLSHSPPLLPPNSNIPSATSNSISSSSSSSPRCPFFPSSPSTTTSTSTPESCPGPDTPPPAHNNNNHHHHHRPTILDFRSTMTTTSPIDIATPTRNSSSSPSSTGNPNNTVNTQTANYPGVEDSRTSAIMSGSGFEPMGSRPRDSFAGAKPISMNNPRNKQDRPRRESLANSLVGGGMSWGGVSVGSWIRDDIIMTGTSPYPMQSPSYHSSSYLPKLEANFMRDFSCCGKNLESLHDLLQHYEEFHAQQTPASQRAQTAAQHAREHQPPNSKAAIAAQAATSVQQQAQNQQRLAQQNARTQGNGLGSGASNNQANMSGGISGLMRQQQQSQPGTPTQKTPPAVDDMDGVEDMEMDDVSGPLDTSAQNQRTPQTQPSLFGQPQRPANLTNSGGLLHQGLRTSQPTTPSTGFGFQNNPTVSSVNTPTLSAMPGQLSQTFSPDNSAPGTPVELDDEFNNLNAGLHTMGGLGNVGNQGLNNNFGGINGNFPYGFGTDLGLDLCIDDPGKRLLSPNGGFTNQRALQQQFAQFTMNGGQYAANEDIIRRLRQQQMLYQGGMNGGNMMMGEEHKPFRCPVVGCEKAYKNQNGLKYHKTHGHNTQQLHENGDGTFSIVNPETSAPYPGTMGMEKEKPYKCEVCGKRYKNLNGLKYHKQHSPPCNPELRLNGHLQAAGLAGAGLGNINVAGLPGIGEENMM